MTNGLCNTHTHSCVCAERWSPGVWLDCSSRQAELCKNLIPEMETVHAKSFGHSDGKNPTATEPMVSQSWTLVFNQNDRNRRQHVWPDRTDIITTVWLGIKTLKMWVRPGRRNKVMFVSFITILRRRTSPSLFTVNSFSSSDVYHRTGGNWEVDRSMLQPRNTRRERMVYGNVRLVYSVIICRSSSGLREVDTELNRVWTETSSECWLHVNESQQRGPMHREGESAVPCGEHIDHPVVRSLYIHYGNMHRNNLRTNTVNTQRNTGVTLMWFSLQLQMKCLWFYPSSVRGNRPELFSLGWTWI